MALRICVAFAASSTCWLSPERAHYVYGDNMSVVTNVSRPEPTLRKKSNSICYHPVHEAIAMGEALVAHIPTKKNLADLFSKVLHGQMHRSLVDQMLWDVFPSKLTLQEPSG
jgi:hypothetical protein